MTPNQLTKLFQLVSRQFPAIPPPSELRFQTLGGGSINEAYRLFTREGKSWFCKLNGTERYPGLFEKEARGLALLASANKFRIPTKIACISIAEYQVLLLEWIEEGPRTEAFWRSFGEKLAQMHWLGPADFGYDAPVFGLDHANYMGALPQDNTPGKDFVDFFIQYRLMPQVALAIQNGLLDSAAATGFETLYSRLPEIFPSGSEAEPPCLLHGDLWSGNFLADDSGQPVLIDPAVYFGHRCVDLAMTTLFGGFERPFYEAYAHHYPFPPNYCEQWDICNLYPLLVHLNLFGPGPSSGGYLGNILHTIRRFNGR